jgi:two-component system, cell cycle sensor histidine kinase and response regulator CckA
MSPNEKRQRMKRKKLQRAQKMEAVGTLAAGVAHDLNNILSGIVSYPELLLLDIPEESSLREPLLSIQKSGQKAADVVDDLLNLARRGVPVSEVINLNDIISDYLESPEYKKMKSFNLDVRFEIDLDQALLNIMASPIHISKVVMNLTSNAAEAISGAGTVRISTECQYLDRPVSGYENLNEGDYVVLTVFDSGAGITQKDLENIFEPFYTTKKMGRSGTGLGLAVVWGVLKDHNGYIDVKSTRGNGSKFTIYFPVTRKNSTKAKSNLALDSFTGKGELILVIDDVEEQRRVASGMLEILGYSVASVSSGEEAVEYIKNNPADLLVLDMIMESGIDGLDTYKKIIELRPGQKAILASGYSETDRVKKAQSLGAGIYIQKPYILEKIGTAIKKELEKK